MTTPYFFASRARSDTSSSVSASGFSTYTWIPRLIAIRAGIAWWWLGVAMNAASILSPTFSNISR